MLFVFLEQDIYNRKINKKPWRNDERLSCTHILADSVKWIVELICAIFSKD